MMLRAIHLRVLIRLHVLMVSIVLGTLLCGSVCLSAEDKSLEITIDTTSAVNSDFGGVGFHIFHHLHKTSQENIDQVFDKRWRELNPSFARVTHFTHWTHPEMDGIADRLKELKNTQTEIYFTTWNPDEVKSASERVKYATTVVDSLEYMVRNKGYDKIKYYCMSNELTLGEWGAMSKDLTVFKAYHQAIFDQLKVRNLPIGLLATDEAKSGFDEGWPTISWAASNMDDITAAYGGHHYEWDTPPEDSAFYARFLNKMTWGGDIAKRYHKPFIVGEFGSRQDTRVVNGLSLDINVYNDTPSEKYLTLQTAEMVLAGINGGVHAMAYWTFADFPDPTPGSDGYMNKWGLFRWSGNNFDTRQVYYGYGLLSRFFRGPATVYSVKSGDELVRVAAVRHQEDGSWSIAVVNRHKESVPISVVVEGMPVNAVFRKYFSSTTRDQFNPFGDMPGPDAKVGMSSGKLRDTVEPLSLTVYTTSYTDKSPAKVKDVRILQKAGKYQLVWEPNIESDFCYYRIYKSPRPEFSVGLRNQIGSTIATEFDVDHDRYVYKVVAVNKSGNVSEPTATVSQIRPHD